MSDAITRLNKALDGRYYIEREVGEGGMATVYLADDLRHERSVALKVLKPELAAVVGADRFLAEIKTTANLQHPHILPLFDSGEADGFLFYVMPYVEGETLREKLNREHQLAVGDAVAIATNMAEALDYAHRQGVVHRDIKPANILLQDGKPVISDFGIALAVGAAGGGRLTETGLSLGTPHYMSPEQATGDQTVGPATDLYALGCVLYEMLVGEPPYTGGTAQAVLGKIVTGEPDAVTEHRKAVPPNVDAAVRRALEKVPADRFGDARSLAGALADAGFRHGADLAVTTAGAVGRWNAVSITATVSALALAAALAWTVLQPQPQSAVARFDVTPAAGQALPPALAGLEFALSPDGQRIVYVGEGPDGGLQLWDRRLDDLEADPISGTEGAENPVFSPDGQSIAFWQATALRTLSLLGGPVFTVLPQGGLGSRYIDWGDDGMLYFANGTPGQDFGIHRVPATGGQPEPFTDPYPGVERVQIPEVLPDGTGVLVTLRRGPPENATIGVVGPDGGEVRELMPGMSARYVASGHILYATADNTLMAARFDLDRLETTGPSVALLSGVRVRLPGLAAKFAVADNGTLVYRSGEAGAFRVVWVDRRGAATQIDPTFVFETNVQFTSVALSPGDDRLAISIPTEVEVGLWMKQLPDGPLSRFTFDQGGNRRPAWSGDGAAVYYLRNSPDGSEVRTVRSDGTGEPVVLLSNDDLGLPAGQVLQQMEVSRDGEWLVYRVGSTTNNSNPDLYAMRLGADTVGSPLLTSDFVEWQPTLSQDGRWLAYTSDETGREEVYVRPFPDVDSGKYQVSTTGGVEPKWSHGGTELFYREPLGAFRAVQVATEPAFSVVGQEALFASGDFLPGAGHPMYDVASDDQRFLMIQASNAGTSAMVLVQNFFEELEARVPN